MEPDGGSLKTRYPIHGGIAAEQGTIGQEQGNGTLRMPRCLQNVRMQQVFQLRPILSGQEEDSFFIGFFNGWDIGVRLSP